jgi:hypothetical protein
MSLTEPEYLDYDEPEVEDPDPEPEPELQAHWDAADEADARFTAQFEACGERGGDLIDVLREIAGFPAHLRLKEVA